MDDEQRAEGLKFGKATAAAAAKKLALRFEFVLLSLHQSVASKRADVSLVGDEFLTSLGWSVFCFDSQFSHNPGRNETFYARSRSFLSFFPLNTWGPRKIELRIKNKCICGALILLVHGQGEGRRSTLKACTERQDERWAAS